MKKKIFTLLTLLLAVCSGAWAQTTVFSYTVLSTHDKSGTNIAATNGTVDLSVNAVEEKNSQGYAVKFGGNAHYIKCVLTSGALQTGDIVSLSIYQNSTSSPDANTYGVTVASTMDVSLFDGTVYVPNASGKNAYTGTFTVGTDLNGKSTFYVRRNSSSSVYCKSVTITRANAPTITTQPVGGNYVDGYAIPALTVAATASAGELSYQWYSCDDANKSNAAAIGGATNASYTPSSTGFYFCRVTDSNGSTDTNVVEVTISAAAAPSFVSITPSATSVVKGTVSTITAEIAGNPVPTIQWYSNTVNNNTTGSVIDGATALTLNLANAAIGTFYYYAVATNSQGSATSDVQTIIVQEKLAAPSIETPSIAFVSSIDVTITDNSGKSATIKYSTDGGTVWNDYTTLSITADGTTTVKAKAVKDGYIESDVVTTNYKKVASLHSATTVSEYTVWDWTKATTQVNLDATTIPSNDAVNVNAADFDGTIYDNVGWKTGFNAQALVMSKFQRPFDSGNKAYQGTSLKFTTTVPGAVKVEFCNTGSSERPNRYLYVNGTATSYKSKNTEKVTTDFIPVAAGEVELKGVIKAGEGADVDTDNYLRVFKVTFAPTETATITTADYATYVPSFKVAVPDGVTASIVSEANSTTATLTPITVIPAGEPVVIYKDVDANTDVTFTATDADPSDVAGNVLKAAAADMSQSDATAGYTMYVLNKVNDVVGFYKLSATGTLAAGKCYIEVANGGGAPEFVPFGFGGGTTGVSEKVIVNSEKFATAPIYNLAGQRVANPTKGLYIVNGKKVSIK